MKARIPPQRRLSRQTLDAVDEYIRQKMHNELTRFLKIVNVVLNRYFGLGTVRLNRFNQLLNEEMAKHQGDPALWVTVDKIVIDELKLPFSCEDYEEREEAMEQYRQQRKRGN